jgi:hypothetical protein
MHIWVAIIILIVVLVILGGLAHQLFRAKGAGSELEPQYVSLPIDPNNPPRTMRYRPREGRPPLYCTNPGCFHALEPGEVCLLWPVPQRLGAYDLFCNECVALRKNPKA